jgi:hypothetical protein
MARRLLALLFAVVVLGVAFQLRSGRDETDPPPRRGTTADPYEVFETREVALLCIEELRPVCDDRLDSLGIEVRYEPSWVTVDRLRDGGALEADAWLTVAPFASAEAAGPGPGLGPASRPLARTTVALVGPTAVIEELDASCPDGATRFACAVLAGPVALRDPSVSGLGTLALEAVGRELLAAGTEPPVLDAGARERLQALVGGARRSPSPFDDIARLGGRTVALTVEADVATAITSRYDESYEVAEAFGARFALRYPLDVRAVEVVVAGAPGFRRVDDLDGVLRSETVAYSFQDAGFEVDGFGGGIVDSDDPPFVGRPPVRTDLRWTPSLLGELRELGLP